ncbi:MAG: WecB/TagA/CpsF family glycosyltransferase [Kiritimatiellales bacterium]|nr:WecB/TagA/CpsF family glycosyltransferase [Kiritimatiellales bacterium]
MVDQDLDIPCTNVLGVEICAFDLERAAQTLFNCVQAGKTGYVCVTSVHGVIESQRDTELKAIHNNSLMTVPDGMPTVWMGREYGFIHMGRVYGPELMLKICEGRTHPPLTDEPDFTGNSFSHFLYGSTCETLDKLKMNLEHRFPGIKIVGTYAPPFRPLTDAEEDELQQMVTACKPDFFWVGLSTPKQERFMAGHIHKLDAKIMLGVGAAFDIHAGLKKDAPGWIKNSGLQWLHRLCQEPKRLWRRYLDIVPCFLFYSALQLLGIRKYEVDD